MTIISTANPVTLDEAMDIAEKRAFVKNTTGEQLMSDQITLEEALELVSFNHVRGRGWQICSVDSIVYGDVKGDVDGDIRGVVGGDVWGDVDGDVEGTINGREWTFVETPKEKLQRLLDGASEEELLKLINQMENN